LKIGDKISIGRNLSIIRELREKTQSDIAKHLGISQQAYNSIELGKSNLSFSRAVELSRILKFDLVVLSINHSNLFSAVLSKDSNSNQYNFELRQQTERVGELIEKLDQLMLIQNTKAVNLLIKSKKH